MKDKMKLIGMLVFGVMIYCLVYAGILNADNSTDNNYILEKTEDFSVSYPMDWDKKIKGEILMFTGPVLTAEQNRPKKPVITIKKETDENAMRSMKKIKENYNRWKKLPDIKNKMLEFMMKNMVKDYRDGKYEFVSSDFKENENFIMQHTIDADKERNARIYYVDFITKAEPVKSYNMMFVCLEEYFDKYLPIFERCVESFSIN